MENPHRSANPNAAKIALRARLPSASLRPAFGGLMMTRHRRGLDAIEPLRGCAS
ncbi:hypothetical protein G5X32_004795 [Salmonella enterica]|nr:hypothetical protein [Salmonella enterica]